MVGLEEGGVRILIVDDDTFVRMILSMELPDVELVEAASINEAVAIATAEPLPDGIIVDRKLPDGDGLDLVRRLRKTFATSRVPILVLTAGFDEADRELVTRAGADDYLAKPFESADLLDRIERVLRIPVGGRRRRRVEEVDRLRRGGGHIDLRDELGTDPAGVDLREQPAGAHQPGRTGGAGESRRWWRRSTG